MFDFVFRFEWNSVLICSYSILVTLIVVVFFHPILEHQQENIDHSLCLTEPLRLVEIWSTGINLCRFDINQEVQRILIHGLSLFFNRLTLQHINYFLVLILFSTVTPLCLMCPVTLHPLITPPHVSGN